MNFILLEVFGIPFTYMYMHPILIIVGVSE